MRIGELLSESLVQELERIPAGTFAGGKDTLSRDSNKPKQLFKLPGYPGLSYSIENMPHAIIKLWAPNVTARVGNKLVQVPIGKLTLNQEGFPIKGALEVDSITIDEDYQGKGLAKALYSIVLKVLKRPLIAGSSQTPGGRRNWVSISQMPGVQVYGYTMIDDSDLDDDLIDEVMGKIGGDYMGDSGGYHFFRFNVRPDMTGQELASYVNTKAIQLYGDGWDPAIGGLYAIWTGQQ